MAEQTSLLLKTVTLTGTAEPLECDSVHLTVSDDLEGNHGGSYGIRKGHAAALIALAEGPLTAYQKGTLIFQAQVGGGFATVKDDTVTVVADTIQQ